MRIEFNEPYLTGNETKYLIDAVNSKKISGNGHYSLKCHNFFKEHFGFDHNLPTTSCTAALEMSAILLGIQPGDEVIMPSYTFVSTANAFVLRGAKIVFCDSCPDHPNIDVTQIKQRITPRTKALVVVHYAGMACAMDEIMAIAQEHNLYVVEDAAQAIQSYYKDKPLGSFGHTSAFSFHETKNVQCGEGGLLVVNDPLLQGRAEIIWEKGTNRVAFSRGEVSKYEWMDIGSSYLPSEISSAFLYAQLECLESIQKRRIELWEYYHAGLEELEQLGVLRPIIPEYATNNGHIYYLVSSSLQERDALLKHLRNDGIRAVFHYLPLHQSPYYKDKHEGSELPNAVKFSEQLLRLPLFYELTEAQVDFVIESINRFYTRN